jgi:hypothetical protein
MSSRLPFPRLLSSPAHRHLDVEHLEKLRNRYIVVVAESDLLPGPYALDGNEMGDVWKIVDDSFGTCMTALRPQSRLDALLLQRVDSGKSLAHGP